MKFTKKIFNEIKDLSQDPMEYFLIEDFPEDVKNDDVNQFYLIPSDSMQPVLSSILALVTIGSMKTSSWATVMVLRNKRS